MHFPLEFIRKQLEQEILSNSGLALGGIDYESPKGDPGLFGPDSAAWKVHRDFTSMIVGGFSALLLQMLHPLALAGVWEHSNFREDMLGRLRRTAQFIAATTYGNQKDALMIIEKVRDIHSRVKGYSSDGRAYSAMDPELLTWVHVAETRSFLYARLQYFADDLTSEIQDQYFMEYASIAERLGAQNVPTTKQEVDDYLEAMRSNLIFDERTAEVFRILQNPIVDNRRKKIFAHHAMLAAYDLLPKFAKDFYPMMSIPQIQISKTILKAIAPTYRWAVRNGAYAKAMRRMDLPPELRSKTV
ncbi:oxygenase MpaB family protein [Sneathiella limimaris]|uniref:oxygenase MpaB family protein n=1 Tax=Sneathiella limimaris TaxID=1964213 RepID=UPI001469E4B9|nr:oxygenase MpaB family protein [Sneathiella limimaris]